MPRCLPSFVAALSLLLACSDQGPAEPAFQTDAPGYTVTPVTGGYVVQVGYVFTNPYNAPAYFVGCQGYSAYTWETLENGVWVRVGKNTPSVNCVKTIVVDGRGQRHDTVVLTMCSSCEHKFSSPGLYRIVWLDVVRSFDESQSDFGMPLPLELRTSNSFALSL